MSTIAPILPALPLRPPSSKVSKQPQATFLEVDVRQVPLFKLRLEDRKLAPMVATFPVELLPIRVAYLAPATLSTLKLPRKTELLVIAMMPELLGDVPLAHWALREAEVEEMARANANSGALLLQIESKKRKEPPIRRVFTPYWLDWQGWSGYAFASVDSPRRPDETTMRYMAYELSQRLEQAPTGLHSARAYLYAAANDAAEAAAACQNEVVMSLNHEGLPTTGALRALALLGRLLKAYNEVEEARAALSLALWLNPNHRQAAVEILPLLEQEEQIVDLAARLSRMPQRPPDYGELLKASAERLGQQQGALENKIEVRAKAEKNGLFTRKLDWLEEADPYQWLRRIGL